MRRPTASRRPPAGSPTFLELLVSYEFPSFLGMMRSILESRDTDEPLSFRRRSNQGAASATSDVVISGGRFRYMLSYLLDRRRFRKKSIGNARPIFETRTAKRAAIRLVVSHCAMSP